MTNPDDQQRPVDGSQDTSTSRGPQGNAPSWVDEVLDGPRGHSPRPNLSKSPAPDAAPGDLRIPEPARPAASPTAPAEDWISRVTGSPASPSPAAPPSSNHSGPARASAPELDAWGEPQRPRFQPVAQADGRPMAPYVPVTGPADDVAQKRLIAGLLGIFLGSLGVHKFYLGLNTQGLMILGGNVGVWVLALLVGLVTLGFGLIVTIPLAGLVSSALGLLGLIEGILYLTKSDADFQRDYMMGKKPWL